MFSTQYLASGVLCAQEASSLPKSLSSRDLLAGDRCVFWDMMMGGVKKELIF